ncbi:MAG: hypothetical protein ACXAC8_11095 [Candidatus Hodarchaeales archaeon]|jgi:hypothetical protein
MEIKKKTGIENPDSNLKPNRNDSKGIFNLLILLSIVSSFAGFYMILGILVDFRRRNIFLYPHGLLLGFLLLGGGLILFLSLIILSREQIRS